MVLSLVLLASIKGELGVVFIKKNKQSRNGLRKIGTDGHQEGRESCLCGGGLSFTPFHVFLHGSLGASW